MTKTFWALMGISICLLVQPLIVDQSNILAVVALGVAIAGLFVDSVF